MMLFWYILLISIPFLAGGVAQPIGSQKRNISKSTEEITNVICRQIELMNHNCCPNQWFNITLEEYYNNNNTGIYLSPYYYKNCLPKRETQSKSIIGMSILVVFIVLCFIIPLTKNQPNTALGYYCAVNHPVAYYIMMNRGGSKVPF
jgi:hypothetical protein